MTHIPEISTENPSHKTGTINWHKSRACPVRYWKLVPEIFVTKLHVETSETGTGFLARPTS